MFSWNSTTFDSFLERMWRLAALCLLLLSSGHGAEVSEAFTGSTSAPLMEFGSPATLSPEGPRTETFCNGSHPAYCTTKLSYDSQNHLVAQAVPLSSGAFRCPLLTNASEATGVLTWFHINTSQPIGSYNIDSKTANTTWARDGLYEILSDGGLLLKEVSRLLVERYICVLNFDGGPMNETALLSDNIVLFRLDFSSWYSPIVFKSVYYGSMATSLLLCAVTFLINIIWIVIQKGGLYWIKRKERKSRMQSVLTAVEVYRQRQIQSLQDAYHRNVNTIREQYHIQVEAIRDSYTNQMTRVREVSQATVDNVTVHLDNVRDGYNMQLSRLKEYGARHAEQLWESYEKQLNRVKTFSLQQRLKLMQKYKIKQRHINELLATVSNGADTDDIGQQSVEIPEELELGDTAFGSTNPPMRRSVSCLSLPEFTLVDGQDQPILKQVTPNRRMPTVASANIYRDFGRRETASTNISSTPSTPGRIEAQPLLNKDEPSSSRAGVTFNQEPAEKTDGDPGAGS